jgi:hypothetical protein
MEDSNFADDVKSVIDEYWVNFPDGTPAIRVAALTLLTKVLENIVANPAESKYLRLNETKVAPKLHGGIAVLKSLGFTFVSDEPGFLVRINCF